MLDLIKQVSKTGVIAILVTLGILYAFRALEWEMFCRHDPGECDYPVIVYITPIPESADSDTPAPPPVTTVVTATEPTYAVGRQVLAHLSPPRSCPPPTMIGVLVAGVLVGAGSTLVAGRSFNRRRKPTTD